MLIEEFKGFLEAPLAAMSSESRMRVQRELRLALAATEAEQRSMNKQGDHNGAMSLRGDVVTITAFLETLHVTEKEWEDINAPA
jgi:hypothetical protein